MDLVTKKRLLLFAGSGNPELSQEISTNLKVPLGEAMRSQTLEGRLAGPFHHAVGPAFPLRSKMLVRCGPRYQSRSAQPIAVTSRPGSSAAHGSVSGSSSRSSGSA